MSLAPYMMGVFQPEVVKLCFRFQVNGVTDPDRQFPAGAVKNVTRTSEGVFAITLPDNHRYTGYLGGGGHVMGSTGDSLGMVVQSEVSDYDNSTGVVTVRTIDPSEAGTAPETTGAVDDPTDDDWVYVELAFIRRDSLAVEGDLPA